MRNKNSFIKGLISLGVLLAILVLIWAVPASSKNIFINLITDDAEEGKTVTVEIYSEEAYEQLHTVETTVTGDVISFKLDYEYRSVDKIVVLDRDIAQSIVKMDILSSGLKVKDYVSASLDGPVLVEEQGVYIFNAEAMNTIKEGMGNPWYVKLIVSLIVVFVFVLMCISGIIRRYFGKFKSLLITSIVFISALFMFILKLKGSFEKVITIHGISINNGIYTVAIAAALVILLSLCLLLSKENKISKIFIICIYAFVLLLSIFKMFFYNEKVGNMPDEVVHIGYIAYLEQSEKVMPVFEEIRMPSTLYNDNEEMLLRFVDGSVSYLKHPPLYHHIMRFADGITFNQDGSFGINIDRLRIFSMGFVVLALILMFYIGYTRIKKVPLYHFLFAMVCTSVPMLLYTAAGVNNDSLTLLTVSIFFFGILRYIEKKRSFYTYLLIGLGISATLLTKMTAGIVVVIAAILVLVITLIKEKCVKELLSPKFLLTVPLYVLPIVYYLYVYKNYGSFQPNMFAMNAEYSRSTGFYVPIEERSIKSLFEYIWYFIYNFKKTWTGISSHISLLKSEDIWFSMQNIALVLIWFSPLMLCIKPLREKIVYTKGIIGVYIGGLITLVMQIFNGYNAFVSRGYMGGFQSRYYLCIIMVFAFCITVMVQKVIDSLENKGRYAQIIQQGVICATAIYISLLAFEDFVYFLIEYKNYI